MMEKSILRNCAACGNNISRYSLFCRNCGHPQGSIVAIWLLVSFLLLFVAYYIAISIYGIMLVKSIIENETSQRALSEVKKEIMTA